jgi:thioester reductase-like protein
MRYATMPGVPGVHIEGGYAAHKAPPGKYSITVKMSEQTVATEAAILANPLYPTNASVYLEYHQTMLGMETELTSMHRMVNSLYEKQKQLESLLSSLPKGDKFSSVKKEGEALLKKMKSWDEDMVQRKSKAYDDVENFPNKFTANYLFLINQTESDIPRVNQPSLDRLKQLNMEWAGLKARANEILDKDIPALNKRLWESGFGAIWKD